MLTVALTGGIATGKSIVATALRRRGCHVHEADRTARELEAPGGPAWEKIVARFGRCVLEPGGEIDRAKLGAVVFADAREREALDGIVHPLVFEATRAEAARIEAEGRVRIFVHEAALTIEAGFMDFYDRIVVTYCPPDLQVARLVARDGIPADAARRRIDAQMPAALKLTYADYAIDASISLEDTVRRADGLYEDLLRDERLKRADRLPGRRSS
jgi:dephospho-CoA kinase